MISSTLAYTFSPQNLHYYCIIAWAKMCIFVQKCAKLCIADDFLMSDKECSWEYKRLEASLLEAERARFELANRF